MARSHMGNCRYCHQTAGLFSEMHDSCKKEATERIESIENCMAYAVIHAKPYSDVSAMVEKRTANFYIPRDLIRTQKRMEQGSGATFQSAAN
jgi:hypothetical protein